MVDALGTLDVSSLDSFHLPYFHSLTVCIVRAAGGNTPSALPSPRTDDSDTDNAAAQITNQKRNQGQLMTRCLARDNNRCVLTGFYDSKMALQLLSDEERQNVNSMRTQAAHIIPFSLAAFTEREVLDFPFYTMLFSPLDRSNHQPDSVLYCSLSFLTFTNSEQRHARAISWEAICRAFPSIREFSIDDINDPRNALTLWNPMHDSFGSFELCLEPTVGFLPSHPFLSNPLIELPLL
jgi:hypothetical protein